ncbi:MAG: hypothetical protein R3E99_12750 [Burkholderiaceae bacterium]
MTRPDSTTHSTTRIVIGAHATTLTDDTGFESAIPVGVADLADRLFRHDPPTSLEMEQAIDRVEDALETSGLQREERGWLTTAEPLLYAALAMWADGDRMSRDEVEQWFQRLASASLGHPGALGDLPWTAARRPGC